MRLATAAAEGRSGPVWTSGAWVQGLWDQLVDCICRPPRCTPPWPCQLRWPRVRHPHS